MERLPGFRDFYPEPLPHRDQWSAAARQYLFTRWRETARRYGFTEYDGPPLEPLELFTTKSGEEIVGQLYHFSDKGQRAVALRPEMTPTLARMAAAHARNYKKPIKWFAIPQLFRYERQQKGRLREHFQFNADILGETDSAADAELVALLIDTLRSLGLTSTDFAVRLSSREAWHQFYLNRHGQEAGAPAFYQVIDKLEREDPTQSRQKLKTLGFDLEEVTQFIQAAQPTAGLQTVVENLQARDLGEFVQIDYSVIRGLAYYTGVVFEAFDRQGEFRAIAGGGRYDNLVKLISGGRVDLAALGFGMGDVVLMELLKKRCLLPVFTAAPDVYCLIEEEAMRPLTLHVVQRLRSAGCAVEYPLTPTKPDRQFSRALELGTAFTLRLQPAGSGEPAQAILRNLRDRSERALSIEEVAPFLQQERHNQGSPN
jgi:histidyl-tRNA synthetase